MRGESEIGLTIPGSIETEGDRGILGPGARRHHAVYLSRYRMTFGLLQPTQEGAEKIRQLLVEKCRASSSPDHPMEWEWLARKFEREAVTIYLAEDEKYQFSTGENFTGKTFTHGVDDGMKHIDERKPKRKIQRKKNKLQQDQS